MLARFLPWRLLTALLLTGVGAVAISISILYNTTVTTEISKLQALAQSHGKLINSVAQYDAQFNKAFGINSLELISIRAAIMDGSSGACA